MNSYTKEVDVLSARSNFLAQWSRNFDSKILGLKITSMKIGRTTILIHYQFDICFSQCMTL